jgi:hypothetical protein
LVNDRPHFAVLGKLIRSLPSQQDLFEPNGPWCVPGKRSSPRSTANPGLTNGRQLFGLCAPRGWGPVRIGSPGFKEIAMTSPDKSHHIEVKEGEQTVATAEVTTLDDAEGTVRASLLPSSGPAPPGSRAGLVDAVMDLPEVQASSRLQATIPLGDADSLQRLRERTEDTVIRSAGSTALVDADIPAAPGQERGGQASAS